jgi:hypothetical protein
MPFPILPSNSATGYFLTKSLRFRSSASAYLQRTPGSAATSAQKFTYSTWVKRGKLGSQSVLLEGGSSANSDLLVITWGSYTDTIVFQAAGTYVVVTSAIYRDPSAWYHICLAIDTTQATASNRVNLYVNGSLVTAYQVDNRSSTTTQNYNFSYLNQNSQIQSIGRSYYYGYYWDGYMAETIMVDGQQLAVTSFGSTNSQTGVWQPAKYTGTYGTNGFYLPFTNTTSTTTLGYDSSGNSNNWTTNNLSLTTGSTYDSMTDVPTLTSSTTANTATINPLDYVNTNTGSLTATNGNLLVTRSTTAYGGFPATIALPTSGKFAFEFTASQAFNGSTNEAYFGVGVQSNGTFTNSSASGAVNDYYTAVNITGGTGAVYKKFSGGSSTSHYAGTGAVGSGDVFQFLVDMTNGTIDIKKNGSTYGTQVTGLPITIPLYPYISMYGSVSMSVNFGQQPWNSTPTSGYVALNTYNLSTPTIGSTSSTLASKNFDINLYTGTGATQSITNAQSFQPSMIWFKSRSNATDHVVHDVLRGTAGINRLFPNLTRAEQTTGDGFLSINSNGFTLDSTGTGGDVNTSTRTYVAWQWAGPSSGSSNTSGSITSTVAANASAGFSVVTYTGNGVSGATIGHGLGVVPSMIITFLRSGATNHATWHSSLSSSQTLWLDQVWSASLYGNRFNVSGFTSSVFKTGSSDGELNTNGSTYLAYCWSPIAGYSNFGSYTGNGSTDGPFSYTGFRPRFVMTKRTDTTSNWYIIDTSRSTYNVMINVLAPNLADAEDTGSTYADCLSNGFKIRTSAVSNASGGTYIYMAFAENPFKYSLAR